MATRYHYEDLPHQPTLRYLVFDCPEYYPQGGWDDLIASADTADEALEIARKDKDRYIVDIKTGHMS